MAKGVWQWPWLETRHEALVTARSVTAKTQGETYILSKEGWSTSLPASLRRNVLSLGHRLWVYPPIYSPLLPEE